MAFAADDLTVPSLVSLLLRVAWIVVVVVFLAVRPGGSDQCGCVWVVSLVPRRMCEKE